jgi:plasmid maintenance system antidote protein VapI
MGVTRQMIYRHLEDQNTCTMKVALKLQDATGISHQFFMYPVPTALQFSGANNNGIK